MPGDGYRLGDGDGDGNMDLHANLFKTRLLRLLFGASSAVCWGTCSPDGCCPSRGLGRALARSGSGVEPEVRGGYSERFEETMLGFYIASICVYSG